MLFVKGFKNEYHTEKLKDNLKYCIGKYTVEIYEDEFFNNRYGVYHYGTLIAVFDTNTNTIAFTKDYDFSNSTGRVRNEFCKYMFGFAPKLQDIRRVEKKTTRQKRYTVEYKTEYSIIKVIML